MVTANRDGRVVGGRGFALVDALVAGILLAVGLAVVIGLTGRAVASQSEGRRFAEAARLADGVLNEVLAVGPEAYSSAFETRGRFEPPFAGYRYEVTLTPGEGGDPYLVTARIAWRSGPSERDVVVETLAAPRRGDEPDPEREPEQTVGRDS